MYDTLEHLKIIQNKIAILEDTSTKLKSITASILTALLAFTSLANTLMVGGLLGCAFVAIMAMLDSRYMRDSMKYTRFYEKVCARNRSADGQSYSLKLTVKDDILHREFFQNVPSSTFLYYCVLVIISLLFYLFALVDCLGYLDEIKIHLKCFT